MSLPNAFLEEIPVEDWTGRILDIDTQDMVEYRFKCGSATCEECADLAEEHGMMWEAECKVCGSATGNRYDTGWAKCHSCRSAMHVCTYRGNRRFVTMIITSKLINELVIAKDDII